ncbi:phosphoenolpyruvate--protein phosphotransferase [Azospirillum sp. TSO22-1]|uniref:phosphoenolpyruvate--protein phosphotransferase n=1 Tax=Azospirillum sp. TSO22-1 TaxID=716789 RepID=UPI000D605BF5|nr:phosphoenolpyruvate--protein phosphotransferase [Azospirillum sp. TSO22-1]PWC31780.1 PTS fructose transporter subunit IIA [Azospirillum sp. TSO22-1]
MLQVTESQVRLGLSAADKTEAIRTAGRAMVDAGLIEPGYIDSMLGREAITSTYLGNGIAIPHGLPQARDLVRQTGVVVVQFPGGVDWGGEPARLVVGIAARSDEHIAVLQRLTGVLGNPAEAARLGTTTDPGAVMAVLNGGETVPAPDAAAPLAGPSIAVTAPSPHGLHARPATALVEVAKRFRSEIAVRHGGGTGNAKSLVSLLRLGVSGGQPLTISAAGDDADAALAAIRAAFAAGLDESTVSGTPPPPPPARAAPPADLDYDGQVIAGISASPGVATGTAWKFQREELTVDETAPDPAVQHRRLDHALAGAAADLRNLHEEFWKKAGAAKAAIFKAHLELLDDPEMAADAHARIDAGKGAGWAWRAVYEERANTLAQLTDALLAGRAADLRDVGRRVLRLLADATESVAALPDHPVILLAEDLEPSDTAKLDPAMVLGLCTAGGGATSHTAIIARSLDIPAVVAAGPSLLDLENGREVIINGDDGVLVAGPSGRDRARAATARVAVAQRREAEHLERYKPAITTDGRRVEVAANLSDPEAAVKAVEAGAEGIGLMRTEFLFLQRDFPPSEEEQLEAYRIMVRAMNGLPIILRTLDIGGDKNVPYLRLPAEENPFLGVRGIRLCFEREDLFRTQLRAMLRASAEGPVRIMYPMIAAPAELARAKAITEEERRTVGVAPVEIGIMVEVPSAVMMADRLAKEVSFFSIGTNDLTQYVLAMDRLHPVLAPQADGLHPAVLRMIERTVAGAKAAGVWVGACGGIAGDPAGAVLLAGLGLTELSVAIPSVPSVKARLRGISMAEAERTARDALVCDDAAEVRALVRDRFPGGAA